MTRNIDDLNLIDDFMMNLVASDPDVGEPFCRALLSVLLQRQIGSVRVHAQRVLPGLKKGLRGVRLDVEVEEADSKKSGTDLPVSVYDIEPHNEKETALPRMMRFRQAKIDSRYMKTSDNDFRHLPNLYILMLLSYDPFGEDHMMYTFRNRCEEKPDIEYDDGLRIIYFNTKGKKGGSQSILNVLNYVQNSRSEYAVDTATKELDRYVTDIRRDPEIRGKYMTIGDVIDREKAKSHTEGLTVGRTEGRAEGRAEGRVEGRVEGIQDINSLNIRLINENRLDDLRRAATDPDYQNKLLQEMKA